MDESPDPLSTLLGFELQETSPGYARLKATVGPEHRNQHGSAHGGFVFALADVALAVAANSHGPEAVAIAASIHYTRPAQEGEDLIAEAREISRSTRIASYDVSVRTSGELVAAFVGTVSRRA